MTIKQMYSALLFSILALLNFSCGSNITYPPVSETSTQVKTPGQFVWHDLATSNPSDAMKFYGDVFGWQFETLSSGNYQYHVIKNNGKAIGGIFKLAPKYGDNSEWIGSMSVENLDKAVAYNEARGGKTVYKIANLPGRGRTALIQDPQGAIVSLLTSSSGDPDIYSGLNNEWLWNELWTTNLDNSLSFYKGLVQYDSKEVEQAKAPYYLFLKDNKKLSGAIKNPIRDSRSAWMPYIKVDDVNKMLEKAETAGAYAVMKPTDDVRNGTVAVLIDPVGTQFTIQEWQSNN